MDDDVFFISDGSPLKNLLSSNGDDNKKGQLLYEYLSYRKFNKKISVPPKIFDKIVNKIKNNRECYLYFLNYHEKASLIGTSETIDEKEELILLANALNVLKENIMIISDKYSEDGDFVDKVGKFGIFVRKIDGIYRYLLTKKEFIRNIGFYDTA